MTNGFELIAAERRWRQTGVAAMEGTPEDRAAIVRAFNAWRPSAGSKMAALAARLDDLAPLIPTQAECQCRGGGCVWCRLRPLVKEARAQLA